MCLPHERLCHSPQLHPSLGHLVRLVIHLLPANSLHWSACSLANDFALPVAVCCSSSPFSNKKVKNQKQRGLSVLVLCKTLPLAERCRAHCLSHSLKLRLLLAHEVLWVKGSSYSEAKICALHLCRIYWMNPLQYITRAILINEFTAGQHSEASHLTLYHAYLHYDISMSKHLGSCSV